MKDNGQEQKRKGRPLGSKNTTTTRKEEGLARWIIAEAKKVSHQTGVGVNQVIEDAFKAGFVAVRDSYSNLIQYRKSIDQLWEKRNEPTSFKGHSEEPGRDRRSYDPSDFEPEPEFPGADAFGDAGEDPTLDGLGDADVGPGQRTTGEADHPSSDNPASESVVHSDGGTA
jgi:hypothetical protein